MRALKIGILAGESSGDILGAGLMQALRERHPTLDFYGIGGPLMQAQGLASRYPMDRLSVMGLVEPLKRLPELLRIRRELRALMLREQVDVFIGIDSPDFNLSLEQQLKQAHIRTVHYVSPSVWAWRQRRIHKIARATDLVLTLFPFEAAFYEQHQVPARCVGHPLADLLPLDPDRAAARQALGFRSDAPLLALLPGSRGGEVARLAPSFIATIQNLRETLPTLQAALPAANMERAAQLRALLPKDSGITLLQGQSRLLLQAADAALLASGTATLEALLCKTPMLVCYRMAPLSYALISRLLKVPYFSLPNLLAQDTLVEELVQNQVKPEILAPRLLHLLKDQAAHARLQERYRDIHQSLRLGANTRAAEAVLALSGARQPVHE
ncbi:MAG: lipid-A-disaccharide synthase [Pseudomonadales bacterium]|jgi:lipid-A-disaccharide synthase|nr:lipid-A-disaccharide synthase [Pseudomonadales bacterium]